MNMPPYLRPPIPLCTPPLSLYLYLYLYISVTALFEGGFEHASLPPPPPLPLHHPALSIYLYFYLSLARSRPSVRPSRGTGELGDNQRLLRAYREEPQSCGSAGEVRQQGQLHCRVEVSARAIPSVMARFPSVITGFSVGNDSFPVGIDSFPCLLRVGCVLSFTSNRYIFSSKASGLHVLFFFLFFSDAKMQVPGHNDEKKKEHKKRNPSHDNRGIGSEMPNILQARKSVPGITHPPAETREY